MAIKWFKKRKQLEKKEDKQENLLERNKIKSEDNIFFEKNFELLPIINEKTKFLINKENTYIFKIKPVNINKVEIKKAIEKIFKVKILDIRTINYKKRIRGRTRIPNIRYRFKKVYIKLPEGQKINIFE